MASNATATGIPHDTVKKRKAPPSANEIFTDTVAIPVTEVYNGKGVGGSNKKVYVAQSNKVRLPGLFAVDTCTGDFSRRVDAACRRGHIHASIVLYAAVSHREEQYCHVG
jgi:hypothetical protein